MQEDDNPYEILGIELFCSDEKEIKKAYRKLAIKFHPDKQSTEEDKATATTMFAKIAEAYEMLTDPVKRYDWRQAYEEKQNRHKGPMVSPVQTTFRRAQSGGPVQRTHNSSVRRSAGAQMVPRQPPPPKAPPKNRPGLETTYGGRGGRGGRGPGPGRVPYGSPHAGRRMSGGATTQQQRAPNPERQPRARKSRDPFLIFEEVMQEEFGKDYKSKIVQEWNDAPNKQRASGKGGLFGGGGDKDKLDLPSHKDMFKEMDINGDKVLSRQELRNFVESQEALHSVLAKSLNLHPQQAIDIATDVAFSLAKWDGKNEDEAQASYFLAQKKRKNKEPLEMTKDEFKGFYKSYVQSLKGSYDFFLRTMFAAYDLNGDGKLQRKEFENFLEIFYHANYQGKQAMPNKAELVRVAQVRLDKNRDGNMSYSEVRDLLQVAAVLTEKPKPKPPQQQQPE